MLDAQIVVVAGLAGGSIGELFAVVVGAVVAAGVGGDELKERLAILDDLHPRKLCRSGHVAGDVLRGVGPG